MRRTLSPWSLPGSSPPRHRPRRGADVVEVSGLIARIVEAEFHAACDGKADVNGSAHQLDFFP
ncbi:MAG: hypothetical protein IT380_21140 [Myxococcales bacterium]|nr:hypothetical protein [Myxococcales bacterium]